MSSADIPTIQVVNMKELADKTNIDDLDVIILSNIKGMLLI